ncbi:nitrile hydratase subunit beta [Mesorhizobium sp. M8A.F.Ca.ET.173.01.1.1]|nr:nitrile hydratase subunit beta [Mesorhizobium sp. M8A.F.Ca.ET.173.01.1.1]
MNGIHDMGGMHGFGPVVRDDSEPVFRTEWERRVFGVLMNVACNGHFAFDESRSEMENMGHARYLATSYYEHWLAALEAIVRNKGLLTDAEINLRKQKLHSEGSSNG